MSAVLHLRSPGQLTSDVQRSYAALARTVARLGIEPTVTIDGVSFFDADAVDRITAAAISHTSARSASVEKRRVLRRDSANHATCAADASRGHALPKAEPGKASRQNVAHCPKPRKTP